MPYRFSLMLSLFLSLFLRYLPRSVCRSLPPSSQFWTPCLIASHSPPLPTLQTAWPKTAQTRWNCQARDLLTSCSSLQEKCKTTSLYKSDSKKYIDRNVQQLSYLKLSNVRLEKCRFVTKALLSKMINECFRSFGNIPTQDYTS